MGLKAVSFRPVGGVHWRVFSADAQEPVVIFAEYYQFCKKNLD